MKICIYWSDSNSGIYYIYIYLNKNWNIYWSEQSFTGLGTEDQCSLWGLIIQLNLPTSIKQSPVLKVTFFLSCHRNFHMNWTSFKRSSVLKDHFSFALWPVYPWTEWCFSELQQHYKYPTKCLVQSESHRHFIEMYLGLVMI